MKEIEIEYASPSSMICITRIFGGEKIRNIKFDVFNFK